MDVVVFWVLYAGRTVEKKRILELKDLLHIDNIAVGVSAADKADLINQIVNLVSGHPDVLNPVEVIEAVLERERVMSTGVGKGLALPHAKTTAVKGSVAALVTLEKPIDFGALDDEPIQIAFMLLGQPDAKSQHVRILSRVSRLMNNEKTRQLILDSKSKNELLDVIVGQSSPPLSG